MHTFIRAYSELVWTHPVIPAFAGMTKNVQTTSRHARAVIYDSRNGA